jgi:hypothetical protein
MFYKFVRLAGSVTGDLASFGKRGPHPMCWRAYNFLADILNFGNKTNISAGAILIAPGIELVIV